ncbi:hypothetical protein GCM10023143_17060 [Compostibacter hankyongensis]|uniref:Cytochrome c domain-containing protein n=2 Tax=Compostibacter hankyongensis TaxID=1007089 RepID=A0ABP8FR23_9BACT
MLYFGCNAPSSDPQAKEDWAYPGGNAGQQKYSALDQINKKNVKNLKVAWIYHSGNMAGGVESTPLIVDGNMYVTTPSQELIALNAADGKEIWRFNPSVGEEKFTGVNRGIAYDKAGEKVFYTSGNYLNAVDVHTGKTDTAFGESGRVKLDGSLNGQVNTSPAAPVLFRDLVIVGVISGTGHVNAYDVHSGNLKWTFNTIPHPGEAGYDTWGDTAYWRTGSGVAVWGGLCVDNKNGIVYFSTGQPRDNFYRPDNAGKQLFGNSIIALNAGNGKRIWHYQAIHHDIWDLDLACPPILSDLKIEGETVPGVMQLSKTGNIFLFNRINGKLLSKVEERPAPSSTLPGEIAYPTQPFVTWPSPFSRQILTEDDLTNRTPEAHDYAKKIFDQAETGWFVPPSEKGILFYGIHGGAEWCGGAYDQQTNTLYVTANELAWHIVMRDINADSKTAVKEPPGRKVYLKAGCVNCHGEHRQGQTGIPNLNSLDKTYARPDIENIIHKGRKTMPAFPQIAGGELDQLVNYLLNVKDEKTKSDKSARPVYRSLGYIKFLDKEGYPATKPPWGTLNAVDLTTGKIKWKVPLGEYEELKEKGISRTGTENFGGCIATKGGLVFVGATRDLKFRAFDADTGEELWEAQLPFGGFATPSTYAVNGKQYVVIAATGGGKLGPPLGDAYVAFALPDK